MAKINAAKYVWMDGRIVRWDDAKIHITSHALHYGSAVFEGIRSYKTGIGVALFRIDNHLERLFHSASVLGIEIKFTMKEVRNAIKKLLMINKLEDAYIRPIAYHGYGSIGVYPKNVSSNIAIIALQDYVKAAKPLRLFTSSYTRPSEKSTAPGAKISGNYANSILAMREAREKGYDEALMLDGEGFVSEGPAENVFIIKDGKLIAPSSRSSLRGFTRDTLLRISAEIGMEPIEKKITLKEAMNADEVFFCGTGAELSPIISIDNKKIGDGKAGKATAMIRDFYFDIVRGKNKKFGKWLAYID